MELMELQLQIWRTKNEGANHNPTTDKKRAISGRSGMKEQTTPTTDKKRAISGRSEQIRGGCSPI